MKPGWSTITRFQLCVGRRAGGIDTCQGDSGGPLVLLTDQGYRQVGITSWGTGCARADTYAVYARVASYLTWIEAVMGGVPTCIDRDLVTVIRRPADYQCFGLPNNDDSSSNPALIGFPVRLGGAVFTAVYVNNNGNLTFGGPLSTYTPLDLTSQPHPMIAPFFADVDTRGAESRIVYYGQGVLRGRRTFSAIWQRIGYYSHHTDRLNTFQVVLTETAPGSGNFSIEFNYGPIEWETGDASDGEGGLGGYSARVGLSLVAGVPDFTIELPGSGIPGSFIEGGTSPLSSSSNLGIPGRYYWTVYNGEAR